MTVNDLAAEIERNLQTWVHHAQCTAPLFWEMVDYHFGWDGSQTGQKGLSAGKKLRPLTALLVARALRGDHQHVMPAAIALEIIHDFTLILDDIMDRDPIRRHQPTLWVRWGINQAMTAGTGVYTIGFKTLLDLIRQSDDPGTAIVAVEAVLSGCVETHEAQVLDLGFETATDTTPQESLATAFGRSALIASAAEVAAILSTGDENVIQSYKFFGKLFATSYSLCDDYLGIWGREEDTGKPVLSDIRQKKKTYPVAVGFELATGVAKRLLCTIYDKDGLQDADVRQVVTILEELGVPARTRDCIRSFRERTLEALRSTGVHTAGQQQLEAFASSMFARFESLISMVNVS